MDNNDIASICWKLNIAEVLSPSAGVECESSRSQAHPSPHVF